MERRLPADSAYQEGVVTSKQGSVLGGAVERYRTVYFYRLDALGLRSVKKAVVAR